jgi:homoserine kinase
MNFLCWRITVNKSDVRRVRAQAGATVANLGPGFDVLGLSLGRPFDVVEAEELPGGGVEIATIEGDGGILSRDPTLNCVGVAAQAVLDRFAPPGSGVRLHVRKGLPMGSGMGSSAASSVAAAVATGALWCPEVSRIQLLDACREGERLATGVPHPDNVAASLLGGVVLCLPFAEEEVQVVRLPVPQDLWVVCACPELVLRTADARDALPAEVPRADAVRNLASVAGLVAALWRNDLSLLAHCLDDRLATPYRKGLIAGYDAVMEAANRSGAIGSGISGSGPTLFALADGADIAIATGKAMVDAFAGEGIEAWSVSRPVDTVGATVSFLSDHEVGRA